MPWCGGAQATTSSDGGVSWGTRPRNVTALLSPGCQGSLAYQLPRPALPAPARLLYSGPDSGSNREGMTLWGSDHVCGTAALARAPARALLVATGAVCCATMPFVRWPLCRRRADTMSALHQGGVGAVLMLHDAVPTPY